MSVLLSWVAVTTLTACALSALVAARAGAVHVISVAVTAKEPQSWAPIFTADTALVVVLKVPAILTTPPDMGTLAPEAVQVRESQVWQVTLVITAGAARIGTNTQALSDHKETLTRQTSQ